MSSRLAPAVTLALAVLALGAPTAAATTINVTTTLDSAPNAPLISGSLRDALSRAQNGDVISVPAGVYALNSELKTDRSITIRGAGARSTVLSGQSRYRVLEIAASAGASVTVTNVTIERGSSDFGGGIFTNADNNLSLINDTLTENEATGLGGALFAQGGLWMSGVLVIENSAEPTGKGGGIAYAPEHDQEADIVNSTIVQNSAHDVGGGIYQLSGTLDLTADTLLDNMATGEIEYGNHDVTYGGNLYSSAGSRVVYRSTIFFGGGAWVGADCDIDAADHTDLGFNASTPGSTCDLSAAHNDVLANDLGLGVLRNNGGPTDTTVPVPRSPLIDAMPVDEVRCLGTDQRGVSRPQGVRCDIGATEAPAPPAVTPPSGTTTTTAAPHIVPPPTGSAIAPRIVAASLTSPRFRVSLRATAIVARALGIPFGTTFHFRLPAKATVKIAITHMDVGLRAHGRCVTPTPALAQAHARACVRRVTDGTLTRKHLRVGKTSVPFTGRIGRHALKPGRYTATVKATNAAGTAHAVRLRFTVVK
jgi:hypothetical protein